MDTRVTGAEAVAIYGAEDFVSMPTDQRRLVTTAMVLHMHMPDEEILIIDRDEIQVTTGNQEVISITETEDRRPHWLLQGLSWDRSGGLSSEEWLGECYGTQLVVMVQSLLEQVRTDSE